MSINEGTLDRSIRVVIGLALVCAAFFGVLGAWPWIGIVPLVTGFVGWCPLYSVLGIDTCATKQH